MSPLPTDPNYAKWVEEQASNPGYFRSMAAPEGGQQFMALSPTATASPAAPTAPAYNPISYSYSGYPYAVVPRTLPGQGTQSGSGTFGAVPTVPNPIASASEATAGNLANLTGLYDLANQTNTFNTGQAAQQYQANLPNYQALTETASGNILDNLRGVVSPDVINLIAQQGAERGVAVGSPGSPNANAAFLRALGLTSTARKDLGQQQLSAAVARTPIAPLFQPQNMFVSPDAVQQAQYQANVLQAAPNPTLAAQNAFQQMLAGLSAGRSAGTRPFAGDAAQRETAGYGNGYGAPTPYAPPANVPYGTPPSFIEYNAISGNYYDTRTGKILGSGQPPADMPNWAQNTMDFAAEARTPGGLPTYEDMLGPGLESIYDPNYNPFE